MFHQHPWAAYSEDKNLASDVLMSKYNGTCVSSGDIILVSDSSINIALMI